MDARGRWKGVVAWSYLVAGLLVLPLVAEFLLEELGLIPRPIEGSLPDALVLGLMLDSIFVGGLIFFGWPFVIAIAWFLRHDKRLVVPALVFLVAELLFALNSVLWPGCDALFRASMAFAGLFGIAAVWAWAQWLRRRT